MFGEALRKARERTALTQAQLAAKVGVTQQAVYYWETEERGPPGPEYLDALCLALDVDPTEMRFFAAYDRGGFLLPPQMDLRRDRLAFRLSTDWGRLDARALDIIGYALDL